MNVKRPNILWICSDQQRFDTIHAWGNPWIQTPNVDRLVADGVSFLQTYCQNPTCTPSRSSFLTGLYPSSVNACINGNERFSGAAPLVTRLLADAGYTCGLVGKLHLASARGGEEKRADDGYTFFRYSLDPREPNGNQYRQSLEERGVNLDEVFERDPAARASLAGGGGRWYCETIRPEHHQTWWCAEESIRFIEQEGRRGEPWLLSVNPYDPHPPLVSPIEKFRTKYEAMDLPGPHFQESDLATQQELARVDFQTKAKRPGAGPESGIQAAYYANIEFLDFNVGRILEALARTGQQENTIIIYMSDHGETLGDHGLVLKGCRFYEGLVHVPLVICWPGHFRAGLRAKGLVELTDIAPTLIELGGAAMPARMHGRSLRSILEGESDPARHRDFVRCEYYQTLDPAAAPGREGSYATMFRDERYKLVTYHGHDCGELYDMQKDPWEHDNLYRSEEHRSLREALLKKSFDQLAFAVNLGPRRVASY